MPPTSTFQDSSFFFFFLFQKPHTFSFPILPSNSLQIFFPLPLLPFIYIKTKPFIIHSTPTHTSVCLCNQQQKMMLSKLVSGPRKKKTGTVPVYLNVYDLTPINGYAYWLGLGVYHSGVQVHGVEYGFGAHEQETTGIFEVQPKHCPGFTFRKSILIGNTDLGPGEVREFMERLAQEYSGNTYHLISKNCNHFCADVCLKLTGKSIPRWVNRLARLGLFCNCVLPTGLNDAKVSQVTNDNIQEGEKKKVRSQSSRYEATSNPPSTSRPRGSAIKSTSQRYCLPSPSSVINASSTSTLTVK